MNAGRTINLLIKDRWPALESKVLCLVMSMIVWPICAGAQSISNALPVNVTASSFSIVCQVSGATQPAITVYSDAAGETDLAGQIGIEFYPLNTGDPAIQTAYERRQNWALLRDRTKSKSLLHVRVTGCSPGATYYYKVHAIKVGGEEITWPGSGPLPSVTTAQESSFVAASKQLLLTISGGDMMGYIVTLGSTNTAYRLSAVVGDGAGPNQVYFNLTDLLSKDGRTNVALAGTHIFTGELLGPDVQDGVQQFALNIPNVFEVAVSEWREFGGAVADYLAIMLGSTNVLAGEAGAVPMHLLVRGGGVKTVKFDLDLDKERLMNLAVKSVVSEIASASIQLLEGNRFQVTLTAGQGQLLSGSKQAAELEFDGAMGKRSAIIPLQISALSGQNAIGSTVTNVLSKDGKVIYIAAEPILEALLSEKDERLLVLYGRPLTGYAIQLSTNLSDSLSWRTVKRIPMSKTYEVIRSISAVGNTDLYRAEDLTGKKPSLDVQYVGAGLYYVVLFGTIGERYKLEYTTTLSGQITWTTWADLTLTNAFQFVEGNTNAGPMLYYRVQKVQN